MNLRIRDTRLTLLIIGWLQLVGGVLGLWVMARIMLYTEVVSGGTLLVILVGLSLFLLSIYAGRQLVSKKGIEPGLSASIINQALQLVHFSLLGNGLSYGSGMMGLVGLEDGFKFNFAVFSSTFNMSLLLDEYDFMFKVNFVAVLTLIVLVDIWQEKRQVEGAPEIAPVIAD